jgi:predicted TIM-barrel fold metal-dependent hydrolase
MAGIHAAGDALRYDVHTHVGVDLGFYLRGWWPYSCTTQDLLQHLDANGIDRAVCFSFTFPSAFDAYAFADRGKIELLPGRVPFDRENALLVQEAQRIDLGRRLLPFAMFDPARCVSQQLQLIEPLVGRIAGLKVQATTVESPIRALLDGGRDLMAFAEQHDLPVLMHTAVYANDPWSQVTDCLAVAEAYPRVRFNLAHSLRFHAEYLRRAAQLPNVWVDSAAHLAHCQIARDPDCPYLARAAERVSADCHQPADVLLAIREILGDRFMWGSDNPYMSWTDDSIRVLFSYADEVAVVAGLPADARTSMLTTAPQAWLFGTKPQAIRPKE